MGLLDKIIKPSDSEAIKVAKIGAVALIMAAIISGIFLFIDSNKSSDIVTSSNVIGSIMGKTGDITFSNSTIIYNTPETATKVAITRLNEIENRVNQTEGKVELTIEDIRLLTQALKDLDQRTSGMEKLPDGRTKFGDMISGEPTVVIKENNIAAAYIESGNYSDAFIHSQNAIRAYEDANNVEDSVKQNKWYNIQGHLIPENVGIIYRQGSALAHKLGNYTLAYEYAKKALDADPSMINNALWATVLYEQGKYQEALEYIEKALQVEPNNSVLLELKKAILSKLK